jgi:vanillate O-demethylase ferredoxin subunit
MTRVMNLTVARVTDVAEGIRAFELVAPPELALPRFSAGSHVDIHVPDGPVRQYSLLNDPADKDRYVIAVLREPAGRGGSAAMHDRVRQGNILVVSEPRNHFPLEESASKHLLLAGGIGITPLLAMAHRLQTIGADWTLHACARSPERTPFAAELTTGPLAPRVRIHHDGGNPSQGLDLNILLKDPEPGLHLYCCGPAGFMKAAERASAHWPEGTVHTEHFAHDAALDLLPSGAFDVELASTGRVYRVAADRTLLEVLRENGFEIESSCEEGVCGTCVVPVIAGEVDHRDMVLGKRERASNKLMTVCCSRAKGPRLTLGL